MSLAGLLWASVGVPAVLLVVVGLVVLVVFVSAGCRSHRCRFVSCGRGVVGRGAMLVLVSCCLPNNKLHAGRLLLWLWWCSCWRCFGIVSLGDAAAVVVSLLTSGWAVLRCCPPLLVGWSLVRCCCGASVLLWCFIPAAGRLLCFRFVFSRF